MADPLSRKVARRLIPFLFLWYFAAYLDWVNVGFAAAAGGIARINAVGDLGGFFGPTVVGWVKAATGRYDLALLTIAGVMLAAGLLTPLPCRGIGRSTPVRA